MKHSEYFEGKVQSLSITGKFGNATVGVIEPGQYTFGTASQETMTVVEGQLSARLPGREWKVYKKGESFIVEPKASFDCMCEESAAYICYYR
ncbi:MAG: hypothetical protein BWY84_00614 [Candidatus Aerophobetes bacterium ADurb.Bin490]|nr:MAG: hypothetical protein BWY84_00614 [Candidatus Aerophobetes bacterium ADurb.Bin490]